MPWVRFPWPPCMAPPKVGTTCAYVSLPAFVVTLCRLPGKLGGEPFMRGTVRVSVGTRPTLR
jgi:hypothetical protein